MENVVKLNKNEVLQTALGDLHLEPLDNRSLIRIPAQTTNIQNPLRSLEEASPTISPLHPLHATLAELWLPVANFSLASAESVASEARTQAVSTLALKYYGI